MGEVQWKEVELGAQVIVEVQMAEWDKFKARKNVIKDNVIKGIAQMSHIK